MEEILPPTPFLESLIKEYGFEYTFDRYIDLEKSTYRDDAPEELKKELDMLWSIEDE